MPGTGYSPAQQERGGQGGEGAYSARTACYGARLSGVRGNSCQSPPPVTQHSQRQGKTPLKSPPFPFIPVVPFPTILQTPILSTPSCAVSPQTGVSWQSRLPHQKDAHHILVPHLPWPYIHSGLPYKYQTRGRVFSRAGRYRGVMAMGPVSWSASVGGIQIGD